MKECFQFDIVERYKKLQQFFETNNFDEEYQWTKGLLKCFDTASKQTEFPEEKSKKRKTVIILDDSTEELVVSGCKHKCKDKKNCKHECCKK